MPDDELLTFEEARIRLLRAYKNGSKGSLLDFIRRPFLDPIEQKNEKGRAKLHPLLITGLVLVSLAIAVFVFFNSRS